MSVALEIQSQNSSVPDYQQDAKKRLGVQSETIQKKAEVKSFSDLNLGAMDAVSEPGLSEDDRKGGRVDNEKAIDLISKQKSASAILRKSEGLPDKSEAPSSFDLEDGILDEIESMSAPAKPSTPDRSSKEFNFKELRRLREDAETEAKTAREALAPLQARLSELEAELEKSAFERTPKFREKFLAPSQAADLAGREFSKEIADDETLFDTAVVLKGRERINFIDEKLGGGAASSEFLRMVNESDAKRSALHSALEKHKETSVQFAQEEAQDEEAGREKTDRNFKSVLSRLAPKLSLYRESDDSDHNASVQQRVAAARAIIMGDASNEDVMAAPFLAVIAKDTLIENRALKAELQKYKKRAIEDVEAEATMGRGDNGERETSKKPESAKSRIASLLPGR